jgi:chlorobactene lauroyltransferase
MLTAKKSRWFEKVFALYNRNLFKRRFGSLRTANLEFLRDRDRRRPLIIYANHSSWWDGLAAFEISRATALDPFIMMEEKQLKKLFLFRRLGAFSVKRENPKDALKSIRYAADILRERDNRALWIFPQGEILPNDQRPLNFFNGISRIIEKLEICTAVSMAIRYEFLKGYKPEIFVKAGVPELITVTKDFNAKHLTKKFEAKLTENLNEIKEDIVENRYHKYELLFDAGTRAKT